MRRKSERKSKTSPEKKTPEAPTRRSHRRRRQKSTSSSPDHSENKLTVDHENEGSTITKDDLNTFNKQETSNSNSDDEKVDEEKPVWQVKSTETPPGGEIQKLKICLQRPSSTPERNEKSPRRHRKHRDATSLSQTDDDSCEEIAKTRSRRSRHYEEVVDTSSSSEKDKMKPMDDQNNSDSQQVSSTDIDENKIDEEHTQGEFIEEMVGTTDNRDDDQVRNGPESTVVTDELPSETTIVGNTTDVDVNKPDMADNKQEETVENEEDDKSSESAEKDKSDLNKEKDKLNEEKGKDELDENKEIENKEQKEQEFVQNEEEKQEFVQNEEEKQEFVQNEEKEKQEKTSEKIKEIINVQETNQIEINDSVNSCDDNSEKIIESPETPAEEIETNTIENEVDIKSNKIEDKEEVKSNKDENEEEKTSSTKLEQIESCTNADEKIINKTETDNKHEEHELVQFKRLNNEIRVAKSCEREKAIIPESENFDKRSENSDDDRSPVRAVTSTINEVPQSKVESSSIGTADEQPIYTVDPARKKLKLKEATAEYCNRLTTRFTSDLIREMCPDVKLLSLEEIQLDDDSKMSDDEFIRKNKKRSDDKKIAIKSNNITKESLSGIGVALPLTAPSNPMLTNRKISIVGGGDDSIPLQSPPSPAKNPPSPILYIRNLVRPFTLTHLKELLSRTGTIKEDGFWINKIKSECYVHYETLEQSIETRNALHGVHWPVANGRRLDVDFGTEEAMEKARAPLDVKQEIKNESSSVPDLKKENTVDWREERERERIRREQRGVREWDLGKQGHEKSPTPPLKRRQYSPSSRHSSPDRKLRKKDDVPSKLLDDLFRKTKATPCIYWLPLSAEMIVIKEEQRRKHMAEHERRLAEIRRVERMRRAPGRSGRDGRRYD